MAGNSKGLEGPAPPLATTLIKRHSIRISSEICISTICLLCLHYARSLPIMPALCSMLWHAYYASNYASIIGAGLVESITLFSANCRDNARADVHVRDFRGRKQGAFFDIRVFHLNIPCYHQTQIYFPFCRKKLMNMEIVYVQLNVDPLLHLYILLVDWARKLLIFTIAWMIFSHTNMGLPITRCSHGYVMPSHSLCCVLSCWPFKGAETCSLLSTPRAALIGELN